MVTEAQVRDEVRALEARRWLSQYVRDLNHREGIEDVAVIVEDGRIGVLPDGTRLRVSGDLRTAVEPGDLVTTSYRSGPYVVTDVHEYEVYGLRTFSLGLRDADAEPYKNGKYSATSSAGINECVLVDGRILKLFEANDDEVFVERQHVPQQKTLGAWF